MAEFVASRIPLVSKLDLCVSEHLARFMFKVGSANSRLILLSPLCELELSSPCELDLLCFNLSGVLRAHASCWWACWPLVTPLQS